MPSLKEIAENPDTQGTPRNKILSHLSLLFIKSDKRPCHIIMNQTDWDYLISLQGITEYITKEYNKGRLKKMILGTLWDATILLVNETKEIKVYHNKKEMKKDFPSKGNS